MTDTKMRLTQEKETLFVPLYSKAVESKRPNPILTDTKAEAILAQVDYDFRQLHVPRKSQIMLAMRAKKLDTLVEGFVASHSHVCVVHLGCGLDSRVERVRQQPAAWYDIDYPDVIALRSRFYLDTDIYHMLGSSVLDFDWMDRISRPGPTIIIAEGLMMYLREQDVKALVVQLHEGFPGSELAFDAFSRSTAARIRQHPSIRQTGARGQWGIDSARDIEQWAAGIRLLEEWTFTESADIARLGWGYRIAFRLASMFRAARNAHRILRYQL